MMQYFDHSTGASNDPKIIQLRLKCGGAAVDAYWYFVEQMHHDMRPVCVGNADAMQVHCHLLCTDKQTLEKWLDEMFSTGLLWRNDNGEIGSDRAMENISRFEDKREKSQAAAAKRWHNADANANAMQTHSERNAKAMPTKQNKTKQKDGIANKSNANPKASSVASAAKAAPQAAFYCSMCDTPLTRNKQTGKWDCPSCCISFTEEKAVTECKTGNSQ